MDKCYNEKCERSEGYCLDSERCEACEAERVEELKREAAPDLYEALKDARDVLWGMFLLGLTDKSGEDAHDKACTALAKAEGR